MKSLKFTLALVGLLFCTTLILQTEAATINPIRKGIVYRSNDNVPIPIKRNENDVPIPIKRTKDILTKKGTTTRIVQTKK